MENLVGFVNKNVCPEWMQDGRGLTDYRPRGFVFKGASQALGVTNSSQFRAIAQSRGVELMNSYNNVLLYKNYCDCGDFSNVPLSTCPK
jgi:hypothetical protein